MKTPQAILSKFLKESTNRAVQVTVYRASGSSGLYRTYAAGVTADVVWHASRGSYIYGDDGQDHEIRAKIVVDADFDLERGDLVSLNGRVMEVMEDSPRNIKGTTIFRVLSLVDTVVPDDVSLT